MRTNMTELSVYDFLQYSPLLFTVHIIDLNLKYIVEFCFISIEYLLFESLAYSSLCFITHSLSPAFKDGP